MGKKTRNLELPIITPADYSSTKVTEMIQGIQGDTIDSAFNVIDNAIGVLDEEKQDKFVINPIIPPQTSYTEVTTLKDGENYYVLTGTGKGGTWGGIVGDIADQLDLQTALGNKANTFSPNFTGSMNITGTIFVNYNTSTSSGKEVATKQDITNALLFATNEEIDALDYEAPSLNQDVLDILGGEY